MILTPWTGEADFLAPASTHEALWAKLKTLLQAARDNGGVLDVDTTTFAAIVAHRSLYRPRTRADRRPATDAPLQRAMMPFGGWRMVKNGLEAYGFKVDPAFDKIFPAGLSMTPRPLTRIASQSDLSPTGRGDKTSAVQSN